MKKILTVLLALSLSIFAATETELERAYAKEFAYLKAQKEMLQKRLSDIKTTQNKKLLSAKRELNALQNLVLKKNAMSEKLETELFRARQSAQNVTDDTSLIETVMMQSTTALKPYGVDVNVDKQNYQGSLESVFAEADALIAQLGKVRTENGKFYVQDGSEKAGRIIKVGNVAAYGIADDVAGALVPAGAGKLKVWYAEGSAESAHAFNDGKPQEEVNIFLYENADKEIEEAAKKTIVSTINSGGVIGWIIVLLGVVALALVALRVMFLMGAAKATGNLAKPALAKLLQEDIK